MCMYILVRGYMYYPSQRPLAEIYSPEAISLRNAARNDLISFLAEQVCTGPSGLLILLQGLLTHLPVIYPDLPPNKASNYSLPSRR